MFGVPLAYLYCEDDEIAALLLVLHNGHQRRGARSPRFFIEALEYSAI